MIPQTTAPVALCCGEPAGIGLELAAKAHAALRDELAFFLIADPRHLDFDHEVISTPAAARDVMARALPVLPHAFAGARTPGVADPQNAQAVIDVIRRAVEMAQSGAASAICTLPIHKKALQDGAGFAFPGHTEFLAHLAGGADVVMMLASDQLRVVPTTIHIALADVPAALTPDLIRQTIRTTYHEMIRRFGISAPKIAVAGLNPHAGEGGAMGHDEIDMITPTLEGLRAEGIDIIGPLPADTMFHARARAGYDVAVCMYHDQALIPIKTLDFDAGVNVTLGLPFVRTSPDHGTGFDIAGQGMAHPGSVIAALRMAAKMGAEQGAANGD